MRAQDVMTPNVVTVAPDTTISQLARLLLERNISAAPVVNEQGRLVGIVSEGDLLGRGEIAGRVRPSWWLQLFRTETEQAREYAKAHAKRVEDVMTRNVVTVSEDAGIADIADLLEKNRIKRVPVLREGRIVGIVSRADLVRVLAAKGSAATAAPAATDVELRQRVLEALQNEPWGAATTLNVIVDNGIVKVWGFVDSPELSRALSSVIENVPGVQQVDLHLGILPAWAWAD